MALELAPLAPSATAQRLQLCHAGFWGKVRVAMLATRVAMAVVDVALAAPMSDTATPCPHLIVTVSYTYIRNSCRYLVLHCCIVVSLLQYNLRMARRCIAARFAPFL